MSHIDGIKTIPWALTLWNWKLIFTWPWTVSSKKYLFQMVKIWHLRQHINTAHIQPCQAHLCSSKLSDGRFVICKSGCPKCPFSMTQCHQLLLTNLAQTLGKDAANGDKKFCQKVLLCSGKWWQRLIISHGTKWKEGNEIRWRVSIGNYYTLPRCGSVRGTRAGLHERRATNKDEYAEIQFCFMLTSWAFVQHCTDCNECELHHSDGKNSSELNKGQIREIMRTGSCYYRSE